MNSAVVPFSNQPTICMKLVLEEASDDIGFLSSGRYPHLKLLTIIGFTGASFADHSVRSPIVEDLVLVDCESLTDLRGVEDFTSLKRIWLSNCPLLADVSEALLCPNIVDVKVLATQNRNDESISFFTEAELYEVESKHFEAFDRQQEQEGKGEE